MFSDEKLLKIIQRELDKKTDYYSEENKLKRHKEMIESNEKEAKRQNNPRIASTCMNNDWD
jgi:hypothetical protein